MSMRSNHSHLAMQNRSRQSGLALSLTLHCVLLLLVLGQVVYLATRHRARIDATSDQLYSLTESTLRIVGGLEKRLVVEAYFSPKEELPADLRNTRVVLDNFLDELVQIGKGKVVVKRFNPIEDKALQDTCTRIGIKPIDTQSSTTTAVGVSRHWQGLRLVYDGGKQKVIEQVAPAISFLAEAILTPAIKEVVTKERRKLGFMEWPSAIPGQQGQAMGWEFVRTMPDVSKRYDFQNYKDAEGALVPDEVETLVLFRPTDLTDRQKYVIDQFLMRGGTIVLFSDVADYGLQPNRQCNKVPMAADAKDSQWKWQDQLLHYGIDQPGQIVADLAPQAGQAQNPLTGGFEYMGLAMQMGMVRQVGYPYFFHAVDGDWSQPQIANKLATMGGKLDEEQAAYYRRTLRPGIDTDEFLFKAFRQFKRGPGMYWPALMKLRSNGIEPSLPDGLSGRVLLWSSPLTVIEDPQASLNPLMGRDLQSQTLANASFNQKLQQRLQSEPRRQAPLMLEVSGTFSSFFVGKDRPKKASELKEEEDRKKADADAQKPDGEANKDPEVGPPAPKQEKGDDQVATASKDPEPLLAASKKGRIVAFADSDFVRDDFTRGVYRQQGGPHSIFGAAFFPMLIDWISQDSDLIALQSRLPSDRKIALLGDQVDEAADRRDTEQKLRATRSALVTANVAGPCIVVLALGLAVLLFRRAQKRRFLESLGN